MLEEQGFKSHHSGNIKIKEHMDVTFENFGTQAKVYVFYVFDGIEMCY